MTGIPATMETAREHPMETPETLGGLSDRQEFDPAAPYGRRADGTPKNKPGRPPGTPNKAPRAAAPPRPTAPAPPKTPPGARKKPGGKPPTGPDYRSGISGIFQLISMPLVVAGARSDAALADAAAISTHGPAIADALHTLGTERPEVAAVLDRVLTAGPYGLLIAAAVPLVVQVMTNHGLLPEPVAGALGAVPPGELVAMMRGQSPAPRAA